MNSLKILKSFIQKYDHILNTELTNTGLNIILTMIICCIYIRANI